MKFSEFYKLIEAAGWTLSKGKKHYKYVHPDYEYSYSSWTPSIERNSQGNFKRDDETSWNQEEVASTTPGVVHN